MGLLRFLKKLFKKEKVWEFGTCDTRVARRNLRDGRVQFCLWSAGTGFKKDKNWQNFDKVWWPDFILKSD